MHFAVFVHTGDVKNYEAGKMSPDFSELMAKMGEFNQELINAGILVALGGLDPAGQGTLLHFPKHGDEPTIKDGPFGNVMDQVCGFWILNVASEDEALKWMKGAPMESNATLEVRRIAGPPDLAIGRPKK